MQTGKMLTLTRLLKLQCSLFGIKIRSRIVWTASTISWLQMCSALVPITILTEMLKSSVLWPVLTTGWPEIGNKRQLPLLRTPTLTSVCKINCSRRCFSKQTTLVTSLPQSRYNHRIAISLVVSRLKISLEVVKSMKTSSTLKVVRNLSKSHLMLVMLSKICLRQLWTNR